MIKKATIIELLILLIAAAILIVALFSFNVNAQELANPAKISAETDRMDNPAGSSQILDLTVFENWYSEVKAAALTCFTLHSDFPAMCFHQTPGNSKPQP